MSGLRRRSRVLPDQRYVLVPYDKREAMSIQMAVKHSGFSPSTLRNWCVQHAIGRRIGNGHWEVSRVALQMLLDGDWGALASYHRNNRDPILMGYFEHVGLGRLLDG
jgi:hypothetical protein